MFFSTDGTKEAAFTTALLSATIASSIAKACTSKDVTECSCDGVKRPFHGQSLKWRGCSVNIRFGAYSAERFMLSGRGNNSEMNTIMKQNVRVGLEVNTVILRAWLRGGGGPREGELPRLGRVTNLSKPISARLRVPWSAGPGNPLSLPVWVFSML